jgi:hypothetical protein
MWGRGKKQLLCTTEEAFNKIKKKDIAIVMGDLNAQVVNDN